MDSCARFGVVDEADVGVVSFVSSSPGCGGVLKSVPEDFVVSEIRSSGEVVQLPTTVAKADEKACDNSDLLTFVLHKKGVDTLEALAQISQLSCVASSRFGIAGIKDSWAVTTQDVTAWGVRVGVIQAAIKDLEHIQAAGFQPADKMLRPGHNYGNRFKLRLRNIEKGQELRLGPIFRHLREHGFVNYIGLQRFGKAGVRSPDVGRAILQQDYVRCVETILLPERHEKLKIREAPWVETWMRTGNANAALRAGVPQRAWVERRLLETIAASYTQSGHDAATVPNWEEICRRAFLGLPKNIRCIYVHSYLDKLWNLAATDRLRLSPDKILVGDWVCIGYPCSMDRAVMVKTDEEAAEYCIQDLVLPRLGHDVELPGNELAILMRQYLQYDGLSFEDLWYEAGEDTVELLRTTLRHVISRPEDLHWRVGPDPDDDAFVHVKCTFNLRTGQYATMVMREVMSTKPRHPPVARHVVFSDSD